LDVRSDSQTTRQNRGSFIEVARRRQIVETAIRTIARRGHSHASLAEIARDAGISKGVISYHFSGKDDLIEEILARLMREPAEFIKGRVAACDTALSKLHAYVRANFEFMKANRTGYVALVDLWESRDSPGGRNQFNADAYEPSRRYLGRILEAGQEQGEFRPLVEHTVASVIQAAIDGVMLQWVFDEQSVDLDACADEILGMISRNLSVVPAGNDAPAGHGPVQEGQDDERDRA
jgi:AcrR family transcriptional regulator